MQASREQLDGPVLLAFPDLWDSLVRLVFLVVREILDSRASLDRLEQLECVAPMVSLDHTVDRVRSVVIVMFLLYVMSVSVLCCTRLRDTELSDGYTGCTVLLAH